MMRRPNPYKRALVRCAMMAGLAAIGLTSVAAAQAQTLLTANARYPRVRLLPSGELIATVLAFPNDFRIKVYSSVNNGASFTQVGTVTDPEFLPQNSSSPNFIRLPTAVGNMPAGTLILGVGVDTAPGNAARRTKIKIYKSTDNGRNWSFVSVAVQSANPKGLWEPDFSIASDGALVMHYADESSPCCSQKLVRRRTYDGKVWKDHSNTVALSTDPGNPNHPMRPGMPVVSKLANGSWLMTYEICGQAPAINCESRYRTSTDGWNYGPVNSAGTRMKDQAGRYFTGTPVNTVLPDGSLLWLGHFLREADGSFSPRNGQVILKSASGSPDGPWAEIAAPVTIPDPRTPGCVGYSPGLLSVANGARVVQLTTRKNATGSCDLYFATGPAH